MWDKVRRDVYLARDNRRLALAEAWVALEILATVDQSELGEKDEIRIILDSDDGCKYYIKPGVSGVFCLTDELWYKGWYGNANILELKTLSTHLLLRIGSVSVLSY